MTEQTYFHGGKPGLKRGEFILPPSITGEPSCSEFGAASVHRRDRVYLTTDPEGAAIFAALHPSGRGTIYECVPVGEIEPDPDCEEPGLGWQVERARIVHVERLAPAVIAAVRRLVAAKVMP